MQLYWLALVLSAVCLVTEISCQQNQDDDRGLFPVIFNLANNARITSNATCGENGPERYCKLVEHVPGEPAPNPQCRVCDANSFDPRERHPIENAIDGTNSWWQSPTIANGMAYHYVTITLDLQQIFQIAYVIVKSANSPRPGNWILEKSNDGVTYEPWQYYAVSDSECLTLYNIEPTIGNPRYEEDDDVICTSFYSKLNPLENGEIHTSLVNGRPSVLKPTAELMEFTSARFIRLRLQRVRTLNADLMTLTSNEPGFIDPLVTRRYYYSIKDISIGGQCICFGHARVCPRDPITLASRCECEHNTCGDQCQECCPGFNQKAWKPGTQEESNICEPCNCHGHAVDCYFDQGVEDRGESLDIFGNYEGGGVCIGCRDNTMGINCELCIDRYYRPANVLRTDPDPCIPCSCNPFGIREVPDMAFGSCVKDDSQVNEGLNPGDCFCKEGYAGAQCDRCARGYQGFPDCEKCPCSIEGSVNEDVCEPPCVCKNNVEGENCDICKSGYYNLDGDNSVGCSACFCFGITTICSSAAVTQYEVQSLDGWAIGDKTGNVLVPVNRSPGQTILTVKHSDYLKQVDSDILYWYAPAEYLQNKLSSYGGMLTYTVRYNENSNANVSTPVLDSDVILKGSNGVTLKQRPSRWVVPDREETFQFAMQEDTWFHENSERYVSKVEFMTILQDVQALMIRATYHTAHAETSLYDVSLEYGVLDDNSTNSFGSVEQCSCPPGFEGLSCEECLPGYRRIDGKIFEGECVPCECNGHAVECDDFTGACIECQHFTTGKECAECDDGYYGDATQGSPEDCVRCACPLRESSNNFSPTCIPDGNGGFICDYCDIGYEGPRCDRCADGYYGNPLVLNDTCKPCMNICNGNLNLAMDGNCNTLTGECLRCAGNTAGPTCNRCADGFYGDAIFEKNCQLCQCYRTGSESEICDHLTGQCQCKPFVTGQFCNICEPGYWDILSGKGCGPCFCDPDGSVGPECDIVTGQCFCKPGVTGRTCDRCQPGYYNFTSNGCTLCDCERTGGSCDSNTGECICPPNTVGKRCQRCVPNAWGHDRVTGCKLCNCSIDGSRSQQCDVNTGECDCLEDYRGRQCDQCLFGYHDFPKCRQCSCSSDGTDPESCDEDGLCGCEDDGQCQCKLNVNSEKCDQCADDSFGLRDELETGCTQCFCFGIIDQCDQADYVKDEIVMTASTNGFFVSDDRSVVQTQSGVLFTPSEVRLNASLAYGEMTTRPTLYLNLPPAFLGNKITSYGGRIRYTVQYFGEDLGEDDVFDILIKGHYHTLVKSIPNPFSGVPQSFDLELIETEWQLRDAIYLETAPRDVFMMALYDVKAIMIRATYGPGMTELILSDLSFEVGIPRSDNPSLPEALGVEECECPDGYQGLSCQECAPGFVRVANGPYLGTCRPCTCNNHGAMCDSSTGVCEDCEHNTSGPMCEECADGFFGNATTGTPDDCQPCACPLVTSSNNFSPTCVLESDGGHHCTDCESGYIGRYCDTCEEGYFGNPMVPGGSCEPCDCNEYGSLNQTCDPVSGQCVCDEGLSGRACDVCQPRHVFTQQGCTSCDDTCTGLLLDDIDELTAKLETPNITGIVPAPWSRLRMMVNATQQLQPQLESYKNALEVAADMVNSLPDGVMGSEDDVMALLKRSEESQTRSSSTAEEANKSDRRAIEVEQLLQETLDKIKALIKDLEDLADSISSQPALENEALLEEAKRILDEIMARNFTIRDQDAMDELERAKESLRKAQRAFMDKVEENIELADRIEDSMMDIMDKFNELINQTEQADMMADNTEELNYNSRNTSLEVKEKMKQLMERETALINVLNSGRHLLENASDAINIGYRELEQTLLKSEDLTVVLPDVRMKVGLIQQNMADVPEVVARAEQHADSLAEYAASLENLFESTRDLAEVPVKAARVYGEIVDTISDANITAHEARQIADEALQQASEGTGAEDSLAARAMNSKERSEILLDGAQTKDSDVNSLEDRLGLVKQDIDTIKATKKEITDKNSAIQAELPALQTDLSQKAQEAKAKADEASGRAAAAKQKTQDVLDALPSQLEKFSKLKENTLMASTNINSADRSLDRSKSALSKMLELSESLTRRAANIRDLQGMMANNLTQITERISLAKSQAASIKLSVDTSGTCIRGYEPDVSRSPYNSVVMNFKTTQADNLLMYLGSVTTDDFLSIETVNGRVKFQWDVGAGLGSVTHPMSIDDDKWYKVEANRYGAAAELRVKRSTSSSDTEVARSEAPPEYSVLDADRDSDFHIGGIPESLFSTNNALTSKTFGGCVGETILDGKNVGLWNFTDAGGSCDGCIESPGPLPAANTYHFDGSGYVIMPKIRKWNTESTTLLFQFKSFDENALLFYVTDNKKDFMSVELNEGRVVYRYDLGAGIAELITQNKYNTGDWVRVSARRVKRGGILIVNDVDKVEADAPGTLSGLAVDDFMYFGGVPSEVEVRSGIVSRRFAGCLREISVNTNSQELSSESIRFVGVTDGCLSKPIRSVGIMGSGYLELPAMDLDDDADITVSFATMQPNAIIFVAKDTNARRKRQINADAEGVYYSMMLNNGRLQVQVNAGDGEVLLTTRKQAGTFNDGNFHVASIVKEGRSIRLTVDDIHSRGGNLPSSNTKVTANRFFVGGVHEDFQSELGEAAEVVTPFAGCIQDLVFNGGLIDYATTTDFERAQIGHCMAPSEIEIPTLAPPAITTQRTEAPQPTEEVSMVTPDTESCYELSAPETMAGTVQFGKTTNSHLQYEISKKSVNKQFKITVEVRSYATTGVIFYLGNGGDGKGDFTALQVIDGVPVFSFDNGAGSVTLTSPTQINDGEWHTIVVSRNRRSGDLTVDGANEQRGRAPDGATNMDIKPPLYVGGVDESVLVPRLRKVTNSLDSCIRKFELNDDPLDLQSPTSSKDTMPCHKTVGDSAYFDGTGYAVLDDTFRVGTDMLIELEFRTTKNNGVLLTVANERNDCFGLELVNGELILRADNGAGKFEAVYTADSAYTLCDNEWHTVSAEKVKNALQMTVDGQPVGGGTDKISSSADTNNPLYVGGYPDTAIEQKALTISEKFEGCIRNIAIRGTTQDMSKAPTLENVQPNSCPYV